MTTYIDHHISADNVEDVLLNYRVDIINEILQFASMTNNVALLNHMIQTYTTECKAEVAFRASLYSFNIDILDSLIETMNENELFNAFELVERNRIDILYYYHSKNIPLGAEYMEYVIECGDFTCVEWLAENGGDYDRMRCIKIALDCEYTEIAQYLTNLDN